MKTIKDRDYSFNHTKKRLKERYNIEITMTDYDYLCNKVQTKNDIILIMTETEGDDTQNTYDLQFEYRGIVRVVWSENRQCVTTVLRRQ